MDTNEEAGAGSPKTPSVQLEVEWSHRGRATLLSSDGHFCVWHSTSAAPPGRPLSGLVCGALDTENGAIRAGQELGVKVRGCKRLRAEPLLFEIEGRFFNLGKAQRTALVESKFSAP